jgi:hypothetical protein
MLMSAPIATVVYGQYWHAVGSVETEMSKGHAVNSEQRLNNCSTAMGVLGKRLPACARTGDKAPAKSIEMMIHARFLLPHSQKKGWSP